VRGRTVFVVITANRTKMYSGGPQESFFQEGHGL
jgi:hypothetical protein